jgi:hypothetical protein
MISRILFIIIVVLSGTHLSFSQTTGKNSPKDFGFTTFNIKGSLDSIHFIVSDTTFKVKKPVFLFCQGSLPYSLFYKEDSIHTWNQTMPFDYKKHLNEYYFVEISKPGIPVFCTSADKNSYYIDPVTKKIPEKYWKNDYVDYYVTAANEVIAFLLKQKWVDPSTIVIAGHSQGSKVVSKLGAINKHVTHEIYLAGNPLGRFDQYIRAQRRDALTGKISGDEAQKEIDTLYAQYKKMWNNPDQIASPHGETYKQWASFSTPMLPDLLKTNIPIFAGYGTRDITSDYCDLLPLDFIRNGKHNLTLKPYVDCDHNFFKAFFDKSGKIISTEEQWEKVADDFFKWIKETSPKK